MSSFFALLPLYIFGNLHCLGMCGPLVFVIGRHRYRQLYFFGRCASFTLAGALAGGGGAVLQAIAVPFPISSLLSLLFGSLFLTAGIGLWFRIAVFPAWPRINWLHSIEQRLAAWMIKGDPFAVFLFGFFTILLPCGQTLVVYSTLALEGGLWTGIWNGFCFSVLTSPSLIFAMHSRGILNRLKGYYRQVFACCLLIAGMLTLLRGIADAGRLPHFVLNPGAAPQYHIVLY